jgi:low affinity Fe/Cu permease
VSRRDVTLYDGDGRALPEPAKRSGLSRTTDAVTDALGHETAFPAAVFAVLIWIVAGALLGLHIQTVAAVATIATFVMVFAVQHTSSREARALNVKVDELIRVTAARNDLIGAEHEGHDTLDERRRELLHARRTGVGDDRSDAAGEPADDDDTLVPAPPGRGRG